MDTDKGNSSNFTVKSKLCPILMFHTSSSGSATPITVSYHAEFPLPTLSNSNVCL